MSKKIICIGSLNVDHILYVDRFADNDCEEEICEFLTESGGQAGNIAAGLGKLGKKTYFFGNIGDDSFTKMLEEDLVENSVDISYAKRTKHKNNTVISIVDKTGERQLYAYNNAELSPTDLKDDFLEGTSFIIFTSLIKDDIIEIYCDIAKRAKAREIKVALDPGNILSKRGFEELKPLLSYCDYIFPSKNELKEILKNSSIDKLRKLVPHIIVTCGKDGVIFFSNDICKDYKIRYPDVGKIIDTTGAGDCFVAAFVSSFIDTADHERSIDYAMHVARMSTTKKGARSMPSLKEIGVFLNEKGC